MFAKTSSALLTLAVLGLSSAQSSSSTYSADQSTSTACPSQGGAHIIVSRGSLEAPPYGVLVSVKDSILSQVPGSTADGTVGYPDTLNLYIQSESDGVVVAKALISDYVSRCPGLPLVLMGYSQGAQVLGDALIGQMDAAFPENSTIDQPLPQATLNQVAALILMGDPTFNVDESSFHVGNASKNGTFPRYNAQLFESTGLASKAQSYCDYNDLFCAGGASLLVHVGYVPEYGKEAAAFVVKKIAEWYAANPSSGSSTTAASAAGSTATASSSKISACASASSGAVRPRPSTSSGAASPTATQSSTTTPSQVASTGAASVMNVDLTIVAGAGALFAGLFAAIL